MNSLIGFSCLALVGTRCAHICLCLLGLRGWSFLFFPFLVLFIFCAWKTGRGSIACPAVASARYWFLPHFCTIFLFFFSYQEGCGITGGCWGDMTSIFTFRAVFNTTIAQHHGLIYRNDLGDCEHKIVSMFISLSAV